MRRSRPSSLSASAAATAPSRATSSTTPSGCDRGEKIGLLRLRLVRPFPHGEIARLLAGRRAVAVIDQNISVGKGGILFAEVASALGRGAPPLVSFNGGLGGRRFRSSEFDLIATALHVAEESGGSAEPHLLFTETEYRQLLDMLRLAGHGPRVP
jgi:pyruvate ferredoxin oxidoreductase alpha subunit